MAAPAPPSSAIAASSPTSSPPPSTAALSGDALRAELEHTKRVLASKLSELRKFQTERETLLARIVEREARVRELETSGSSDVERSQLRVKDLERELALAREIADRVPGLEAALGAMRATFRRIEKELSERDAKLSTVEAELADRGEALARLERQLGERDAKLSALEQELSESLGWSAPPADDLKRIKGIGPKFERLLNEMGMRTFAQVATWTEEDVARVAERLNVKPLRIAREGWSEAARKLMGS